MHTVLVVSLPAPIAVVASEVICAMECLASASSLSYCVYKEINYANRGSDMVEVKDVRGDAKDRERVILLRAAYSLDAKQTSGTCGHLDR